MKKIVTILGARPQFVKAAVLSRIIKEQGKIEEVIIHTGQHFDTNMSTVFFKEMEIQSPSYNLNINGLSHGAMTGQMMEKIEEVLIKEKPNAVVVYGDTNSTFAGAMTAKKMGIKVIHIEAGLRSFNMDMPEEINRILTDRISDLLICPTDVSLENLSKEGFDNLPITVEKLGDIMKDAVLFYSKKSSEKSTVLDDLQLEKADFVLATIHRQDNTDEKTKLRNIFLALDKISLDKKVVMPLHPRTKKMLLKHDVHSNITFIDPVGYFDMLELLKNCAIVVTDSGGLQKEAFFNNKYCIIAREETEWKELVTNGYAKIVGSNSVEIINAYHQFKDAEIEFTKELYGSNVGFKIHQSIVNLIKD
ncbi:MAG: UDP-N-acetylglucosamine 2-epimerase (non-hydrolyzing) [Flavobacteriaceae bacterium]